MHSLITALAVAMTLLGTSAASVVHRAAAQPAPTSPAVARTVIAGAKLPSVVGGPLHFRLVSVTLPAEQSSSFAGASGIIYQVSGSTEVSVDGRTKALNAGEGIFIAEGAGAILRAGGGGPSIFLHLLLTPAAALDQLTETAPAAVKELYRTAAPLPDLKPGVYDLNLTRVTFPPEMPSNAPHYRSGAALYYILSGTGANTITGKTEARAPGSIIYEPAGLVHQWGNPGSTPLAFLVFNINPEGTAAVVPVTASRP
jgi:quercetin dioxygenase-like cupin family protein